MTLRERLATLFEVTPEGRLAVVRAMMEGYSSHTPFYWLYLSLSMVIATLGLVLGSTGVVIGAMLVSPLMGPIVGLAMGLAIGSPLLVLRSLARIVGSIVWVVGSAAVITLALPFQEMTSEIAARTSPTVLDLLVAMGCALAAATTTMRPGTDSAGAAAGTAIGISLVPPLCVVGFGLGTMQASVAQGAALLFTANLCSILLFASVTFLVFGFELVDITQLEEERMSLLPPVPRLARWVRSLFGSHRSPLLRLLMPLALLASVYVPLRQALREVSWEVTVRSRMQLLLNELPLARDAVRSQIVLERQRVHLRLVVVSDASHAVELQRTLEARAAAIAGVTPTVEVLAVPDVAAMQEATRERVVAAPSTAVVPDARGVLAYLTHSVAAIWPGAAGRLLSVGVEQAPEGEPRIVVRHLGAPIGAAAEPLLAAALASAMGPGLHVRDAAIDPGPFEAAPAEAVRWLPTLARALDQATTAGVRACVTMPPVPAGPRRKGEPEEDPTRALVRGLVEARSSLASWSEGPRWSVRLQEAPCVPPAGAASASAPVPAASAAPSTSAR